MIQKFNLFEGLYNEKYEKPDSYELENYNKLFSVKNNFIISRNKDGSVLSTFKNDIWDLSPYSEFSTKLNFNNISITYRNEIKRLLLIIIVCNSANNKSSLAPRTLDKYIGNLFLPLLNFLQEHSISLKVFLEDEVD